MNVRVLVNSDVLADSASGGGHPGDARRVITK
jgi:hypothetical protein